MNKYELIESDEVSPSGRPLFQVVALRDFGFFMKGDKGGYIESEANLSHGGNCWVYEDARVFDDAQIFGNAQIFGKARVFDKARVFGKARVFDKARVSGAAWVSGTAWVFDNARVSGAAWVSGTAWVHNNARIFRDTQITAGYAFAIKDNSWDITEVDNGNGTSTLYADAVFEPAEPECDHVTVGVPDEEGKAMVFLYCPKCGEEL